MTLVLCTYAQYLMNDNKMRQLIKIHDHFFVGFINHSKTAGTVCYYYLFTEPVSIGYGHHTFDLSLS